MAIEKPVYRVIEKFGPVEIRDYREYWIAECRLPNAGELRWASNQAFTRLFNFIAGDNAAGQKIAMTSPVQQFPTDNGWAVSFVVPSEVASKGIPAPLNSSISIKKMDEGRYAVLRYNGLWNDEKFVKLTSRLREVVTSSGYSLEGLPFNAVYNPPLTPPPLRHNEVIVKVSKKSK